jgi:hypothetical protein
VIAQHAVCERCLPQRNSRFDAPVDSPIRYRARSLARSVSALRIGARSSAIVFLRKGHHLRRLEWCAMPVQALPIVDSKVELPAACEAIAAPLS